MKKTSPFVITISRQLGSGGAYIGQKLANELKICYADREIITETAKKLSILEEGLQIRDEKLASFWQTSLQSCMYCSYGYIPPQIYVPTDRILFEAEAEVIQHIAKSNSAVIIGRCGSYILSDHPNHLSIFLHGDAQLRKKRVQELYNLNEEEAAKMISRSDKDRAQYHRTLTKMDWTDSRQYDLSIDTSKIGLDNSVELILKYIDLG